MKVYECKVRGMKGAYYTNGENSEQAKRNCARELGVFKKDVISAHEVYRE